MFNFRVCYNIPPRKNPIYLNVLDQVFAIPSSKYVLGTHSFRIGLNHGPVQGSQLLGS